MASEGSIRHGPDAVNWTAAVHRARKLARVTPRVRCPLCTAPPISRVAPSLMLTTSARGVQALSLRWHRAHIARIIANQLTDGLSEFGGFQHGDKDNEVIQPKSDALPGQHNSHSSCGSNYWP